MMKKSELKEMKVKELRTFVREQELAIVGAWKMKKDDLVEKIFEIIHEAWVIEDNEVDEAEETEEVEEVAAEPVQEMAVEEVQEEVKKKGRKSRRIELLDPEEVVVEVFENQKEAVKYVMEKKLCNSGWLKRSLKSAEKFYMPDGKRSQAWKKTSYHGVGYSARYIEE